MRISPLTPPSAFLDCEFGTALVAGASSGAGRDVTISLAEAGFKVSAADRSIGNETAAAFAHVASEAGGLDVLVNSAWGGYESMVESGSFTWPLSFWEQPFMEKDLTLRGEQ